MKGNIFQVCDLAGRLGNARAFAKVVLKYLPVIGWSSFLSEDIFLDRSWDRDKEKVSQSLERLESFPSPVWLHIFPEGTRKTEEKLKESQEFAASRGLTVLKNHLTPRTKGFTFTISETSQRQGGFSSILDLTVVPSKGSRDLTFRNILCGKSTSASIFLRKYNIRDVPGDEEGSGEWLRNLFVEKDEIVQKYDEEESLENLISINNVSLTPHDLKAPIWTLYLAFIFLLSSSFFFVWVLSSASPSTWAVAVCLSSLGLYAMKFLFGAAEIKNKSA